MRLHKTLGKAIAVGSISVMALAGCSGGADSGSGGAEGDGGSDSGGMAIPKPDVRCDVPAENLDDSKVDTSAAKGEITFMTQNLKKDFEPFFTELFKQFEEENPGTKIIWQDKQGGPDFEKLMTADALQCQMADVINVPQQTVLALAKGDLLMDLDVKAPGIGDKFIKDLWEMTAVGHNNAHVGLPWYTSGPITTYNKTVFERNGLDPDNPPKTMDGMFEMAHKIAAAGNGDYGLYGNANWYMGSQLIGMGAKLMNDDHTEFIFAKDEHAIRWVSEMAKLYQEGGIPRDSLTAEPDPNKAYFEGNLAIGTPNPSFLRAVRKNNPDVYAVTGVSSYPTNEGVKQAIGAQYIAVSATTKNSPLAVKFAEWMTEAEQEYRWAAEGGAIIFPPAKEGLKRITEEPPSFADDEIFTAAYKQSAAAIENGKADKSLLYIEGNVQKALVDNVNKGVRGEMSPEEALQAAQDEMNKLLKRTLD